MLVVAVRSFSRSIIVSAPPPINVFCLEEESRDVKGAEADDREPFRAIVVELVLAQCKREHEELKYLLKPT